MRIAALDIGGTSIKSGIWTGRELAEFKIWAVNGKSGGAYMIGRALEILRTCADFDAIGISTTGRVNTPEGTIRSADDRIPGYTGMKVREVLEREFRVPAAVENDVRAAALGEGFRGAGMGFKDFLYIRYGAEVKGAIVIDHKVYTGSSYSAGSFSGILTHPDASAEGVTGAGRYERYASTSALAAKAKRYDRELDNAGKVFEAMDSPAVRGIIDSWIDEIVYGLVSLVHIFNPSCVVLGGGVMAQAYVAREAGQRAGERLMDGFGNVEFRQARLGKQAELLGAASLAARRLKGEDGE